MTRPTNTTTAVPVRDYGEFATFLGELERRPRARSVKVDDQGLVDPVPNGRAMIMQPRVRIVVTALDLGVPEILRWERKWNTGNGAVTLTALTGRGTYTDPTGMETRRQVTAKLQARGFVVSDGEWTPASAGDAL